MSSSSASSSSKLSLTSILCDKELGKLLREWHAKPAMPTSTSTMATPIPKDLPQRLEKLVDGLPILRVRDPSTDEEEGEEESVAHFRAVIQGLLQRAIHHDPINTAKYQQLIHHINPTPPPPPPHPQQLQAVLPLPRAGAQSSSRADFESKYRRLGYKEKFCLMLFSILPEGCVVNNTEVFYFLHSLGDVSRAKLWQYEVDNMLAKCVSEGLISRHTPNHGFSYYYFTFPTVRSWLLEKNSSDWNHSTQCGLHIFSSSNISIVININNRLLNSHAAFNLIPSKTYMMLYLGSWSRHSANHTYNWDDYIVVDQHSLHMAFLQQHINLAILSLRGTSGIVHFPDSVSNLKYLRFLDLSACNNLESLPKGIQSMRLLEYLDLSECYLLEHIPIEIATLSSLKVLKGFIINNSNPHLVQRTNMRKWCKKVVASSSPSSSCPFTELSHLENLEKLTIRTQRMSFPTNQDLHTLCSLPNLYILGIAWVGNPNTAQISGNLQEFEFPNTVKKLELQSAPRQTTSQLLELIGKQQQDSHLNKLYIKGGWFQEFDAKKHCFPTVEIVRLRYLRDLEGKWDQFKLSFPNLTHLEVFQCPKLVSFPCDNDGIWHK